MSEQKKNEKLYPCADCGELRTKEEGGTVFTVCDKCWDKNRIVEEKVFVKVNNEG